jgi:hypothetical protein
MLDLIQCPDPTCRALAEVIDRFSLYSTDGPVEHVRTRCLQRHHFTVPAPELPMDRDVTRAPERPRHADSERAH